MTLNIGTLRSGLQFLSCESENICRLCLKSLSSSESVVKLNQTLKLTNRDYYDEPVTLADVFGDLDITTDKTLPQLLCETCTVTVVNGFLLPKLLAHSERTWHSVVQHFERNLEKGNQIKDISNALYLPLTDDKTQYLFLKRLEKNADKATAISIFKKLKPVKHRDLNKSCKKSKIGKSKTKIIYKKSAEYSFLNNENYQCNICLKKTKTKTAFKIHLEKSHSLFLCPKCLEPQASKDKLKEHKQIHKQADTAISVICPKCDKTYANKTTFKLHEEICGRDKNIKFICSHCNQGYIRKNSLRTHIKTTHGFGKLFSCEWCEKKFDAISKLKEHTIKHTQVKTFTCEFCGAKCGTAASLACHIRLHTGEKPFQCSLCDEKFVSASRRIEHLRRKHEGPHKECHICSAKYYSTAHLKKHLEGHSHLNSKVYEMTTNVKDSKIYEMTKIVNDSKGYEMTKNVKDSKNYEMTKNVNNTKDYEMIKNVNDGNVELVTMRPEKIVESKKDGEKFYVYIVPAKSYHVKEKEGVK